MKALGHIGCAALVACLAPFGGFAAEGASAAGPLKVGVYADDGASGIGAIEWFRLVNDSPEMELKLLDGEIVRAGGLDGLDLLVMPGGIGTLEEFFEMLTLKQLGRHTKPMAILNTLGYYDELLRMLEKAADSGFMSRQCLRLFHLCTSPAQALEQLLHDRPISGGSRRLIQYTEN